MLKKLKAAMGAGAATVDAVLAVGAVRPGDNVTGVVRVEGGDIEQEIERITVALETVVEVESGGQRVPLEPDVRHPGGDGRADGRAG